MNVEEAVDHIEHHGVKGQRWGVRRNRSGGHNVDLTRVGTPPHPDHSIARELKGRHLSTLSNQELKALNTRIDLEQKFHKLTPSTSARMMKIVQQVVSTVGTANSLANILNDPQGQASVKYAKKILGGNKPSPAPAPAAPFASRFGKKVGP